MTLRLLEAQPLPPGTHHTLVVDDRHVEVWEPSDRHDGPRPVLLAHDGQNLFLPGRSFGGVPWGLDHALARLPKNITLPYVIAPWNRTDVGRASDYAPQQILQSDPNIERGFIDYFGWTEHISAGNPVQWCADSYIGWCTEVLMPAVVHEFNWYVDETDIAVMGSSMGGLASAYALALKPNVFSTALCLSTHWLPGGHALARALTSMLPAPEVGRRVWFDHGTENLDSTYGPFQVTADEVMKDRGYRTPTQWRSSVYDGSDHNEASWNARLPEVLMWWLDKADKP